MIRGGSLVGGRAAAVHLALADRSPGVEVLAKGTIFYKRRWARSGEVRSETWVVIWPHKNRQGHSSLTLPSVGDWSALWDAADRALD